MAVDFHMHSTCSDGVFQPEKLLDFAFQKEINSLALTDHDEISGLQAMRKANSFGLKIFNGIEFSSEFRHKDIHILGYGFNSEFSPLQEYITFFKEKRRHRILEMIHLCQEAGYDISMDDLKKANPHAQAYGRPHLAQLLVDKQYATDFKETFKTILHPGGICYVPKYKASSQEIISLIHDAGGIAVLAHPILVGNDDYVKDLLELPFDGIEVYHSKHNNEDIIRYLSMAKDHNLLVSGGSDFHGIPGRYPYYLGEYVVKEETVQEFIRALEQL